MCTQIGDFSDKILQYLKEQRVSPKTFIPLDSIKATRIEPALRDIGGTAKLVYDIIK